MDLETYNHQKEVLGDKLFGNANPILLGLVKDTPEAITYMQDDIEKQYEKKIQFKVCWLLLFL